MNDDGRQALDDIQTAWNAAARSWDPVALAEGYTADALLLGGRPGHFVGVAAIRDYFASYAGVILSATMRLVDQQILPLAPGVFVAQGFVDFAFLLVEGRTKSFLRATLVIVLQDGRWKIRQHHFSPMPAAPPLGQS